MDEDPQREKVRRLGRHDLHGEGKKGKEEREGQRKARETREERERRTGWLEKKIFFKRKWEDFQGGQTKARKESWPRKGWWT
ncbi:uncharacterized protein BO88DRAFT_401508 [Aspergillus vadensis CBS 113365]|uniref:Uncharacterized protein n=1 Tax=Aspergillus vadensis (strain CBS 113365 / IMI 142717 / IBT 24658) TaxID=1448311 RepID=A0A319BL12_ASPVC|nr:hypothetical protein BO88DRAFT_401508 [Aspergillus vadensis CBS 113365]PYH73926.1 hypothetical protein BO88DRAFT_401508 [Aspergillus vadensis CBS 113365]